MKNYVKPLFFKSEELTEGVFAASGSAGPDCLDVTWWEDNPDGQIYRFVFKVTHKGHQSYGQTIYAQFSVPVQVTEADGMVTATVNGNEVKLVRDNQLNDNGLVELWVKIKADSHPTVLNAYATDCKRSN